MKLVSELSVLIENGSLGELIESVEGFGCSVARFEIDNEIAEGENTGATLEIIYGDRARFQKLVKSLTRKQGKFVLKEVKSSMEEFIDSGLLEISGKIPLEKNSDYETNLLGAAELIQERIREESESVSCGINRNVVQVIGIQGDEASAREELLKQYCLAETEAVVLNRFADCKPYPLVCTLQQGEDIIRILKNVEQTFGAARIISIMNSGISVYEQLAKEVTIPVVFRELDEIPVYLMALVLRMAMKHKLQPEETTIGIVGINFSAIRLTRLLRKYRFARILGYDTIEKILLNFENEGGLATTTENIFGHTDIIIILDPIFKKEDLLLMRPGQYVINMANESEIDRENLREQGVRDILQGELYDLSRIFPGILTGIMEYGINSLDDMRLLDLARKMGSLLTDDYRFPELFGPVHSMVADFLDPAVLSEK